MRPEIVANLSSAKKELLGMNPRTSVSSVLRGMITGHRARVFLVRVGSARAPTGGWIMKYGVALAAGVFALGLVASTAQAGGSRGGPHSYPSHGSYGHSNHGYYGHGYYGHSNNDGWAIAAGITGALFGVAAIADAVSGPYYAPPPVVYQAAPPVYYYPAAPPVYYSRPPVYYGAPPVYYGRPPY